MAENHNYPGLPNVSSGIQSRAVPSGTVLFVLALGMPPDNPADDSLVLPQGVSRAYVDFYPYLPTTHRYNADGERERLASPFSNAALDSTALDVLAPLDPGVGGIATLGTVAVEFEYAIDVLDIGYAYGLSDNLSIGFHVPYYWIENDVDIDFDSSSANVGLNPDPGPALIPLALGGIPLDEDQVQQLIGSQYGFEEVDSWKHDGIGDIELGAKYRFRQAQSSALAISGGLRIPTGYEDDADELNDVAWSYGTYALLFRLHYDYLLSNRWKQAPAVLGDATRSAGDLLLNLTFRFDYMLPDDKIMRVGDTPEQTFTANRERVERELGDIFNLEISTRYWYSEAFSFGATYTYGFKSKDRIDGDRGYNYSSLETDTDYEEQVIVVSANYSTLAAYQRGRSIAPMDFSIAYRERFDGHGPQSGQTSPRLYTRWVVVGLEVLFR